MKRIASLILALVMLLAAMPAAFADEPVEITMWTLFSGEDGSTMNEIVANFNASQNEVKLNHIVIDYVNLMSKLALAVGDDAASPHMFVAYATDLAFMADAGRIQPMEDLFAAYPEFDFSLSRYNPACEALNVYNGQRYAVTLDFPSEGMYANMELVNEYCPEVLEDDVVTWDELMAVGAKLKADGVEDIAVLTAEWAMNDMIHSYLLYNTEWASADAQELQFDKEAMKKGMQLYKDAYDAGYLWDEGDDCVGRFAEGSAIFFTGGNWCMNAVKNYGFDFRFIAPPQLDAENVMFYGDAHSFFKPTRSYTDAEKRALGMWMAYFYEHSLDWAQAGSLIAATEPRATAEFEALPQAFVANNYKPYSPMYKYNSILTTTVISGLDWQAVYGYLSADDYADAIVKQTLDIIAQQ